MNYKKILYGAIILVSVSIIDIFWFRMGHKIETGYLANNLIRHTLEIINNILKFFWQILPFALFFVSIFSKNPFYKKISTNNFIHFLIIVIIVLFLKYTTGKARPPNADSPFDYKLISIYSIKQKNSAPLPTEKCYNANNMQFCMLKNHDSFPSGETASAFIQSLYLYKSMRYGYILIILSTLVPIIRLSLYRHWWFDCAFSILLAILIINQRFTKLANHQVYNNKM